MLILPDSCLYAEKQRVIAEKRLLKLPRGRVLCEHQVSNFNEKVPSAFLLSLCVWLLWTVWHGFGLLHDLACSARADNCYLRSTPDIRAAIAA